MKQPDYFTLFGSVRGCVLFILYLIETDSQFLRGAEKNALIFRLGLDFDANINLDINTAFHLAITCLLKQQ